MCAFTLAEITFKNNLPFLCRGVYLENKNFGDNGDSVDAWLRSDADGFG
jgi:hypothetical protein